MDVSGNGVSFRSNLIKHNRKFPNSAVDIDNVSTAIEHINTKFAPCGKPLTKRRRKRSAATEQGTTNETLPGTRPYNSHPCSDLVKEHPTFKTLRALADVNEETKSFLRPLILYVSNHIPAATLRKDLKNQVTGAAQLQALLLIATAMDEIPHAEVVFHVVDYLGLMRWTQSYFSQICV